MKAEFKCLGCGHEYKGRPGSTTCPRCGDIWVRWVNYEEWRAEHPIVMNKDRQLTQQLNIELGG